MSEFSERLARSFKQAADIATGKANPGTYRITTYDDVGRPSVIADLSEEVLAQIDAEIATEREIERPTVPTPIRQLTNAITK